jgi:hypothetical protein
LKKSLLFGWRGRFDRGGVCKKISSGNFAGGILCAFGFHCKRIVILIRGVIAFFVFEID